MNTKLKLACWILPCLLGVATLIMLAGCEGSSNEDESGAEQYFAPNPYSSEPRTEPEAQTLDLAPLSYIVSYINQTVVFTVSGGEGDYHWSVSHPGNGSIHSQGANQAVYISSLVADNSITVQDDVGHFAASYIQTASSTNASALTVSPASVTLSSGQQFASFTVSGGTAPFSWTSGNVRLGTVSYSAGTSYVASYTAVSGAYGQNVITVADSEGRIASATITQTQ